ncbi:hypothetical protein NPA07_02585 [Mycoplasmopsis caviae]|uniref:Uncharacterized protein n=1 Tax=Mycoplasmopsis caviae TaxID=55603 RepID=A0A3P8MEV7_9BACT|nr:hypothetical protein [Mycoplasmopsis caviae]UUD35739.1 hypothetical protein NPA07_02585 [Mycoplasmopsis caviae]VDR42386.1 Uncharacterised protein [Mycoplasmopsis caviae]
MTKKKRKVVGISLGIAGAIVGTLSIGTIVGVASDKRNYSKEMDHIKDLNRQFNDKNVELENTYKDIDRRVKRGSIDVDIEKELNNILDKFKVQIEINKQLQNGLLQRLQTYSKYKVGHHPGSKQFLRKAKNYRERQFFEKSIPEGIKQTDELLETDKWLLQRFDKVNNLAKELISLKDSDNWLINTTKDKESKFSNLESSIKNYVIQKDKIQKENGAKKLTADFIIAGLELISSDRKLWEEGVLAKFNEKVTTNSISKQILNNTEINKLIDFSNISADSFTSAKEILAKYFTAEGYVIELLEYSRNELLDQLELANTNVGSFINDVNTLVSKLTLSLRSNVQSFKLLEKTDLVDFSNKDTDYKKLFQLDDEYINIVKNTSLYNLEKVTLLLSKSSEIINTDKNLNTELQNFSNNEIKTKINNINRNLNVLVSEFDLANLWEKITKYSKSENFDFSSLKVNEYLTKRDELIEQYSRTKTDIIEFAKKIKTDVIPFITSSIDRLKTKVAEKNLLSKTQLLNLSIKSENYNELYSKNNTFKTYQSSVQLKSIDSLIELVTKVDELNSAEKSLNNEFASFITSELKEKVNSFNGNLNEYIKFLKFESDWKEITEFSNTADIDFSQLKKDDYLSQRDILIDTFANIKSKVIKLKDNSISYYTYAKARLNAFKDAYNQRKANIENFNLFNFSYSEIREQEARSNEALAKNFNNSFNSANKDLNEFLNDLLSINKLSAVDSANFEAIKRVINSNVSDSDKLPSVYEFSYSEIDNYKNYIELEEVKQAKKWIETKNDEISTKKADEWAEGNIDTVKNSLNLLFGAIEEIQTKTTELNSIKHSYKTYLDKVVENVKKIESILNNNHAGHQRNVEATKKISLLAKTDYLDISSKREFDAKSTNTAIKIKEDFASSWNAVFKEYDKFAINKKSTDDQLTNYSHKDIAYLKNAAEVFVNQQHKLIEDQIDKVYEVLDNNQVNWLLKPDLNQFNSFSDSEKTLSTSFIKNLYDIVVTQFGYDTIYNLQVPKYKWNESRKSFDFDVVNILRNGENEYSNKTAAMQDAKNYSQSNRGLKPSSSKASHLYKRYGFNLALYGIEWNGKNFNNEFLVPGKKTTVAYSMWDRDTGRNWSRYDVTNDNWIFTKWNSSINSDEIGSDVASALDKIKANDAPYILDTFFDLLNYENKLTHNVIDLLKSKEKIIDKTEYNEILAKLVKSFSKLYYASLLSILSSYQSYDNKALELPNKNEKDNVIWNVESQVGNWYEAGMSRILPVEIDSDIHNRYKDTWSYGAYHHKEITTPEGHFATVHERNTEKHDKLHSDISSIFSQNNIDVSMSSTHVISTSGAFQLMLLWKEYFNANRKDQNIFTSFYTRIDFNDEFGNQFNTKHFDWWRFNTITEYKRRYGAKDDYPYLKYGLERHKFTDFFTNERLRKITTYTPINE